MKTNSKIVLAGVTALSCAFGALAEVPVVTSCSMSQAFNRIVTVKYAFADSSVPAVVTFDVKTNITGSVTANESDWVSVGGEKVCNASGAVWRRVTAADRGANGLYTIKWDPTLTLKNAEGEGFVIDAARAEVTAWPLDNTPDYMVVDLLPGASPDTQKYYPSAGFVPGGVTNDVYKLTALLMRKIAAKGVTWTMGSYAGETSRSTVNEDAHLVALTNNYYIGVYEWTSKQWQLVATNSVANNAFRDDLRLPKDTVSPHELRWTHDTVNTSVPGSAGQYLGYSGAITAEPSSDSFIGLLRLKTGLDFDLPSEAEWELAARAGHGNGFWGDGSAIAIVSPQSGVLTDANLALQGVYRGAFPGYGTAAGNCRTSVVGSLKPNSWGLYDMYGNVKEICRDWYEDNIATAKDVSGALYAGRVNISPTDPTKCLSGSTPSTGSSGGYTSARIVLRGGDFWAYANTCRSAARDVLPLHRKSFQIGFRVVCPAGLR